MKQRFLFIFFVLLMTAFTCAQLSPAPPVELKNFPLNSLKGVRAVTGVSFDPRTSADGRVLFALTLRGQ